MTTKTKPKTPAARVTELPDDVAEKAREIWLAGLGALSAVEEEGGRLFTNLVDRGQSYEKKRQRQLGEALNEAAAKPRELAASAQELANRPLTYMSAMQDNLTRRVEEALTTALDRFGVPTRQEVKELTRMVETLTQKVETLAATLDAPAPAAQARATFHVVPHEDGWAVQKEGNERATSVHATKDEALEQARTLAKDQEPSQLIVHKKDGTIQDSFAYGG